MIGTKQVDRIEVSSTDPFEEQRRPLLRLAYRMLGSVAEAEDMVQEAWLRWHGTDKSALGNPKAFLTTIVTRLCLDHLKSARSRRETYVGAWLPEPLIEAGPFSASAPDADYGASGRAWTHGKDYSRARNPTFTVTSQRSIRSMHRRERRISVDAA